MYITLRADDSGKALKVTSLCLDHNHEVSQVGCLPGRIIDLKFFSVHYCLFYRLCLSTCLTKGGYQRMKNKKLQCFLV